MYAWAANASVMATTSVSTSSTIERIGAGMLSRARMTVGGYRRRGRIAEAGALGSWNGVRNPPREGRETLYGLGGEGDGTTSDGPARRVRGGARRRRPIPGRDHLYADRPRLGRRHRAVPVGRLRLRLARL